MHNIANHQKNADQNCEICFILSELLSSKRTHINNVDEDVEKRELSYTAGGNVNWCHHYGKQYDTSSKNYV